ncbi:tRNA (adenosine(37)-N6)-threonylcarbamoyltransferase complex dimerization subunit type 1 TsaB [Rickettsiella endosymbiont of Rhagonycha lignosa]|uniref:tRNA (adenosine(37)-N6)-threonylcarbamoyltransferase complex dimerization subunit type 1 TsaB n=1 Tax=Rickettsiella endosymbiont of Rhagonycha lignosa TaxID=3077937 RepID=UPI00313C5236
MSLKLLAIDTCTEACSAALLYEELIQERYQCAPRAHSQLILPMMQSLLDEAGLMLRDLDALAFTRGPGSFTGIRIAASVIQASAFAADLPVVLVSSLHCLAQGAYRELQAAQVLTAIDARLQEVFSAAYRLHADTAIMQACGIEQLCLPHQCDTNGLTRFVGVGSGWDQYHDLFETEFKNRLQRWVPQRYPKAYDAAVIAADAYRRGETVTAAEALPTYLRETVALRRGCDG